jgi:hypothetical protein
VFLSATEVPDLAETKSEVVVLEIQPRVQPDPREIDHG